MRIYITLLFLVFTFFANAQSFNGGVYAGLAATQIDGDNYWGFNKAGPILGGFVDTYFDRSKTRDSKKGKFADTIIIRGITDTVSDGVNPFAYGKTWGAKFGLRYIEKGSNNGDINKGSYYKVKLHYVEMPLSLRYMYNKKFEFEGGLSFGYLVNAKEDKGGYGMEDADPAFNAFELAGFLGLAYHFSPKWSVGAQYGYSVLPIRAHSAGSDYTFRGQFNNYTMLFLNYLIDVK